MAKEKGIDGITCAAQTAKKYSLWHKSPPKINLDWKPITGVACVPGSVIQLVFNCCHCTKVKQWTQRSLADVVAVSPKNNAALTGQTGGGLIGWLVGCVAERW